MDFRNDKTMEIKTRLAEMGDIKPLVQLLDTLFTQDIEFVPDYRKQKAGLEQIISNPEIGGILVLEANSEIIGMVSLLYSVSTALGGKVAILEDMIIEEKYRGRKLGSTLLNEAIQFARSKNCLRITLLTDYNNDPAIGFYQKAGFCKSEMIPMRLVF